MIGILILVIIAFWIFIAKTLTQFFTSKVHAGIKKKVLSVIIFALLFSAPVADEIIGGFQFRALCTPDNLLIYDAEKVEGKTVEFKDMPSYSIRGKMLPMNVTYSQWIAPKTGEVLIEHKIIYARSGWLGHLIGWISSPLTFNGSCDSKEYYQLFERLNIKNI